MMTFQQAWRKLHGVEGGFVDDPSDSGGATRYGITERVAREEGYTGRMRDLPLALAMDIARRRYWDVMALDDISRLDPEIAYEMFDTGYNMGPGTAGRFLQRSLNVLNRAEKDYPDVVVDGAIGPASKEALRGFLRVRGRKGSKVLWTMLNCLQGSALVELGENREKDERFMFGWFSQRVGVDGATRI